MLYSGCDFVDGESVMRFEENCVSGMLCQEMVGLRIIFVSGKARIETWYISNEFL